MLVRAETRSSDTLIPFWIPKESRDMSHVGIKCRSQDMSKFVDCSCRRQILSLGYHVIQQTTSSFSYVANTLPAGYTHRNTWYMQVCLRGMCCPASPCQRFGHSYSILTTYLSQLAWTGNKVSMLWQAESLSFCRSWKRESLAETFKNQGVPERYVINSIQILRLISFLFLSFFFFFFNHIQRANKLFSPYQARWEEHCFLYSWVGLCQKSANSSWVIKGSIWVIWEHFVPVTFTER